MVGPARARTPLAAPAATRPQRTDATPGPPQTLGAPRWAALRDTALARAGGRCAFTGAPAGAAPLAAVPVLRFLPRARAVAVAGVAACAAPLARARRLDLISDPSERAAALALLIGLNGWGPEDLERYLKAVFARRWGPRARAGP
jgi:hypothetical protein